MNHTSANLAKVVCLMLCIEVGLMSSAQAGWPSGLVGRLATSFVAQERAANSYQTDLWKMEFQQTEKDASDLTLEEEAEGSAVGIRRPLKGDSEEWGDVPGTVYLSDVSQDTPFAEWQVDKSASGRFKQFSAGPTAWVMSHVRAKGSGFQVATPHSDGPSMLTLLVAIIACMVMIGAMFAER